MNHPRFVPTTFWISIGFLLALPLISAAQTYTITYENGVMKDLGTITSPSGGNGQYAYGLGINNDGVVVGESTYQENPTGIVYHAFVYSNGKMKDLNRLIPPNSGWVLSTAYNINDAGQIVGYGTIHNQQHAFLLTPQ